VSKQKKVLVIGGSGFMGSHTADELFKRGFNVVIFDTKRAEWHNPEVELIIGDVMDQDKLLSSIDGVSYVYHFASIADIAESKLSPRATFDLNIMGLVNVLDVCIKKDVEKFVYASTMYVYSESGSFYRSSKQCAELIIESYAKEYKLNYNFLRYGSLYGPRSQKWNGLRRYVEQVVNNGKLIYKGSGKEIREYIHVADAARLSVDILDNKFVNSAITVTGHQVLNSQTLIDMIFEISGVIRNVEILGRSSEDHYETTPYKYSPKKAIKIVPDNFIDIGQGILDLVEEINDLKENKK